MDRARRVEGTLLLVFDEAHLLSGDALVDLRLLVSSAIEQGPPMKILLAGQDHLRQTLKRSEYTDIVNRIRCIRSGKACWSFNVHVAVRR